MVYIVLLMDRHTDPELFVFASREAAEAQMATLVDEYEQDGYDTEPFDGGVTLGEEGDYIYLIESEVQA